MTTALVNTRTRKQWAKEINLAWFKSVDDVCDMAQLCAAARSDLGSAEYQKMCAEDLQFRRDLANRFRQLGERPDIISYARAHALPPNYTTIFQFLPVDKESLRFAVEHKLVDAASSKAKSRAVATALTTNSDRPVGEDISTERDLPSPKEANEIARATGKMVAASDNRVYTGTDDAEQDQYNERRDQFYQTLDAISFLADLGSVKPEFFLDNSEEWWTEKLSASVIGDATEWLARLKETLEARQ